MRKISLLLSALLVFSSSSQSGEIEGEMICKVKSNYVVEISEGKTETYSGIEDSFSEGDSLVFKFFSNDALRGAEIKLLYKDSNLVSNYISSSKYSQRKIELKDNGFSYGSSFRSVSIYSDYILLRSGVSEFRIERYYKSDWSGIFSNWFSPSGGGMGEVIATLDCRQSSDKVDEFIQYVRGLVTNE